MLFPGENGYAVYTGTARFVKFFRNTIFVSDLSGKLNFTFFHYGHILKSCLPYNSQVIFLLQRTSYTSRIHFCFLKQGLRQNAVGYNIGNTQMTTRSEDP